MSSDLKDLIDKFLELDPQKRLGGNKNIVLNQLDLQTHIFFKGINYFDIAQPNYTDIIELIN